MKAFIWRLEGENIDYRIIDKTTDKMRVLLKHEDRNHVIRVLQENQFKSIEHFLSKANGYLYKYQLHEFEAYIKEKETIEIYYELPCMSLTPKILLPLDRSIQRGAWDEENQREGMKFLSEKVYMVFLIAECVFFQNKFSDSEKQFFSKKKKILQTRDVYQFLSKIFFLYTDCLLNLMITEKFNDIYSSYIKFLNY